VPTRAGCNVAACSSSASTTRPNGTSLSCSAARPASSRSPDPAAAAASSCSSAVLPMLPGAALLRTDAANARPTSPPLRLQPLLVSPLALLARVRGYDRPAARTAAVATGRRRAGCR
jgi:hypothetical protein